MDELAFEHDELRIERAAISITRVAHHAAHGRWRLLGWLFSSLHHIASCLRRWWLLAGGAIARCVASATRLQRLTKVVSCILTAACSPSHTNSTTAPRLRLPCPWIVATQPRPCGSSCGSSSGHRSLGTYQRSPSCTEQAAFLLAEVMPRQTTASTVMIKLDLTEPRRFTENTPPPRREHPGPRPPQGPSVQRAGRVHHTGSPLPRRGAARRARAPEGERCVHTARARLVK